ncbi:hypothetical protein [Streptomyces hainanensis]|uniref:Uncharacterized protein n=1 Tax=Streptomyces hainanensis TaxID=402648 RepID=A0A4R4TLE2_9ACTN|nr:hypothetical protein E1283_14290 [Streptomyces hainanensis]
MTEVNVVVNVPTGQDGQDEQGGQDGEARAAGRHRARSPIISPGVQPALLTMALAGVFAATAPLDRWALLPALVVLQAVTAAGWFRLNGMWPARQGIALAFAGGLAADAALLLVVDEGQEPEALLAVLGVWFLLVLVLQLRHHGSADERLDSLTATAAATLLTGVATGYLAATAISGDAVAVTMCGVAAATWFAALRLPFVWPVLALGAAAGAGAIAEPLTDLGTDAMAFAAAGGVSALIGLRVASYDFPSRFVHFTAGVALPLTMAAPAAYLLGLALL